jgi:hypothetical protein
MDNRRVDELDALHARAVAEGRDTYVDSKTGYEVFTAAYLLRRGICCGSGCRHCPFGHENVKPAKRAVRRPSRTTRRSAPKRQPRS